jgi:predicted DNA-binding transcriptional regulator YafY
MTTPNHDTLVRRLAMMLVKLNQGECLDPQELATEFGVNIRTIQRDINERFSYLPLEKSEGRYRIAPAFLGKLTLKDIERFAALAGVSGLFPSFSGDFLRDIFDNQISSAFLVKGFQYEDLRAKEPQFKLIEQAIIGRRCLRFSYESQDGLKSHHVQPHKLLNVKGIWYLAATHDAKLKTYSFAKIHQAQLAPEIFQPDPAVLKKLESEDGIWMSEHPIEVVLLVDKDIASYFQRRNLIANQVIEKQLEDGSLIVSAKVGHTKQILPIIKYWIPKIRVISPESLKSELRNEIQAYLSVDSASA